MRVGVPKETRNHDDRVGLTPSSVRELRSHDDPHLRDRLNAVQGRVTHAAVARSLGRACVDATRLLV